MTARSVESVDVKEGVVEVSAEYDLEETAERLGHGGLTVTETPCGFYLRDPSANTIHLTLSADVHPP